MSLALSPLLLFAQPVAAQEQDIPIYYICTFDERGEVGGVRFLAGPFATTGKTQDPANPYHVGNTELGLARAKDEMLRNWVSENYKLFDASGKYTGSRRSHTCFGYADLERLYTAWTRDLLDGGPEYRGVKLDLRWFDKHPFTDPLAGPKITDPASIERWRKVIAAKRQTAPAPPPRAKPAQAVIDLVGGEEEKARQAALTKARLDNMRAYEQQQVQGLVSARKNAAADKAALDKLKAYLRERGRKQ